jgi:hypothetical protein
MDAGWVGWLGLLERADVGVSHTMRERLKTWMRMGKKLREAFLHIRLPKPEQCS